MKKKKTNRFDIATLPVRYLYQTGYSYGSVTIVASVYFIVLSHSHTLCNQGECKVGRDNKIPENEVYTVSLFTVTLLGMGNV